jgi:hypothetical protein
MEDPPPRLQRYSNTSSLAFSPVPSLRWTSDEQTGTGRLAGSAVGFMPLAFGLTKGLVRLGFFMHASNVTYWNRLRRPCPNHREISHT